MVDKYDLVNVDLGYGDEWYEIGEDEDGSYVLYADYAELRALCEDLVEKPEECSCEIEPGCSFDREVSKTLTKYRAWRQDKE